MRVVGGLARGRILHAPPGSSTRPTSDRVREAVFSMLTSMDLIAGTTVLDLFAGSGALGIESLSRGASRAVLVDSAGAAVRAVRVNLAVLGPVAERATLVQSDALRYLGTGSGAEKFDVVFADPPYGYGGWAEVLNALTGRARLVVAETGASSDPGSAWETVPGRETVPGWETGPGWETVKVRRYGDTVVSLMQPAAQAETVEAEEGES